MGTLTKPLKDAGVAIPPVIQRIWQWLHDNGTHHANGVADAIGVPRNNASSTLGILCTRGMAIAKKQLDKSTGNIVFYYTVNPKMKQYELLPVKKEIKDKLKLASQKNNPIPAEQPSVTQVTEVLDKDVIQIQEPKKHLLDTLSVREAYALYLELKSMFNTDVNTKT